MTDQPKPASHEEIWELLPWYVNGTLEAGEQSAVETHLATCAVCARELEVQRRLSAVVAETEGAGHRQEAAWQALEGRLAAEAALSQPRRRGWRWSWSFGVPLGAVAAALAAVLVLAVVSFGPEEATFRTLTSPAAEVDSAAVQLRIRPAPGADLAEVRAALESHGLAAIEGPTETGLMRAEVAPEALETALAALAEDPLIALAVADPAE